MSPIINPGGGGGGGSTSRIQTGAGEPVGSVTPTGTGYLYSDTTSGAIWVATGPTSSDWVGVSGNTHSGQHTVGISVSAAVPAIFTAAAGQSAALRDLGSDADSGNGIYWNPSHAVDGLQDAAIQVGTEGAFTHSWLPNGVYDASGAKGVILPTSDPHIAGALYNLANVPTISTG